MAERQAVQIEGRARELIEAPNFPYEYVSVRGRVVEDTHDGADEHIDGLARKYLNKDEYPFRQPGEQRVKFLIEPEWVRVQGG